MKKIITTLLMAVMATSISFAQNKADKTFSEGSTAYFCNIYGNSVPLGLCKFNPESPNLITQIDSTLDFNCADYANGYIYAYIRVYNSYSYHFCKIDPENGVIVEDTEYLYFPTDIAFDNTTGVMYATENGYLYHVNLANGEYKPFTEKGFDYACIFFDKGQLYGITTTTGILYKIDKNNGETTLVGNTGLFPKFIQSAAVDPVTGKCYWAFTNSNCDKLYELDLLTAETTFIRDFAECTGLCFATGQPSDYEPVSNLTAETNENNVTLSWDSPVTATPTGYRVICNDNEIATTDILELYCHDMENGTYEFCVTAIYDNGESQPVCTNVTIEYSGIGETPSAIRIFPNPASNIINIEANEDFTYCIYNSLGQMMTNIMESSHKHGHIYTNSLSKGVYFIETTTSEGKFVRKIILEK